MRLLIGLSLAACSMIAPPLHAQSDSSHGGHGSNLRDPFFSPRGEVTARVKAGPPPAPPALTATSILVAGDKSTATLRGTDRFVVVGVGDWIDGWRVTSMTADGVALHYGPKPDGPTARLEIQRFARGKGGKVAEPSSGGSQTATYTPGSGAALPGGDIPLLPDSPSRSSAATGEAASSAMSASRARPMQPVVPRLAPNP